jgi:hypothetical protein
LTGIDPHFPEISPLYPTFPERRKMNQIPKSKKNPIPEGWGFPQKDPAA